MSSGLKGKLAIDTSALIELIHGTASGQKVKDALEQDDIQAYATELAIAETKYILCRKLGWAESSRRVNNLLASGFLKVEDTPYLIDGASKLKCGRAILST